MNNDTVKLISEALHDHIVVMQAALIEWKHGGGAEAALGWIENTLCGPGLLPDAASPYGTEAQAYFDANRSNPFPLCPCGRPSNILWMGKGFCCDAHFREAHALWKAEQAGEPQT